MGALEDLPPVAQRFLRYVQIDTQSDPESSSVPSTEKQKDLGRLLLEELRSMGIGDAAMDEFGYVYATLPSGAQEAGSQGAATKSRRTAPVIGLLAHMDTSPDEPGAGVRPMVHRNYAGDVLTLPGNPSIRLDPAAKPELLDHIGHDIITSDGTTLLGSDDKAGVAILMQLAEDLSRGKPAAGPEIRLCFTVDEEIGRGVDKLDLKRFGADVAYTIDGGGVRAIYAETFNAAEATLDIRGVMVHPGYARGIMVNALRILSEFIAELPAGEAPETTDGEAGYFHPHTVFEGDAGHVRAKVILRDFDEAGLHRRKVFLGDLVRQLKERHPGAEISLKLTDQYKNMRTYVNAGDPRVVAFAHEAAQRMGFVLEEKLVRGGTDGARLSELGIPTPNIFNGGHDFHSRFEWNTVQNLELALAFVKELLAVWSDADANER